VGERGRRTVVITLFVDGAEGLKDIPRFVGHAKPSTTAGYVRRPEPTVREMLLDRVDELVDRMARELEDARTVTEHLHPQRARSCRNAITMASVMIDEIRLRAHAPTRRARALRRMYLRPWGSDNA